MKITLIGHGKLGSLIAGRLKIFPASESQELTVLTRTSGLEEKRIAISNANIIILAVKPQDFDSLISVMNGYTKPEQFVVSVMTGITSRKIARAVKGINIVRVCSSTLLSSGSATNIWHTNKGTKNHPMFEPFQRMMQSWGHCVEAVSEGDLEAAMVLVGSMPAFIAMLISEIAKSFGTLLEENLLQTIVANLAFFTAETITRGEATANGIIAKVRTSGGITNAGILAAENAGINLVIQQMIQASIARAAELKQ